MDCLENGREFWNFKEKRKIFILSLFKFEYQLFRSSVISCAFVFFYSHFLENQTNFSLFSIPGKDHNLKINFETKKSSTTTTGRREKAFTPMLHNQKGFANLIQDNHTLNVPLPNEDSAEQPMRANYSLRFKRTREKKIERRERRNFLRPTFAL